MITRRLKILYNKCGKSRYKAINGEILSVKTVFGGDELVIFDGGVTTSDDERGYGEIESAIKAKGLKTDIGKFESGE